MMKKINYQFLVIVSILSLVIYACTLGLYPEGQVLRIKDLSPICQKIVKAHNFSKVRYCGEHPFILEGRGITLVQVTFGNANDCPSGCFYSYYKSVIDDENEYTLCYSIYENIPDTLEKEFFTIPSIYPKIFLLREKLINDTYGFGYCIDRFISDNLFTNSTICRSIQSERYKQKCLREFKLANATKLT